jgi:hypothetical protein
LEKSPIQTLAVVVWIMQISPFIGVCKEGLRYGAPPIKTRHYRS